MKSKTLTSPLGWELQKVLYISVGLFFATGMLVWSWLSMK